MKAWLCHVVVLGATLLVAACHHDKPAMLPTGGDVGTVTPPGGAVPPAAADPAPVTEGAYTEAWVHGMRVVIKRVPGAEAVSTRLAIRGGVRNWSAADAGIERLALATAATGGTEKMPKDAFTNRLSELGTTIATGSREDYGSLGEWSLAPVWDESFRMLVDAFRHPALPASQLELERQAQLAAIRQEQDDPDSRLSRSLWESVYRGLPYEHRALGTVASVQAITPAALRAYLEKLRETSRLMLVVVGDVDPAHVIETARAAFGDLPRGAYEDTPLAPPRLDRPAITVLDQKLPTNYIMAVVAAPRWSDADFDAMSVGMYALHEREFREVRTKRNLSYAPSAFLREGSTSPMLGIYVTAVDPVATLAVMLGEAKRLRDEPLPPVELAGAKATFLTQLLLRSEDLGGQAEDLVFYQLIAGDWHRAITRPERVRAVTAEQIQGWARAHLTHLQVMVIGDGQKLDRKAIEAF